MQHQSRLPSKGQISFAVLLYISIILIYNNANGNNLLTPSFSQAEKCNCVAFRLDDIQDYFLSDIQIQLVNLFKEKGTALTIGVIGGNFGQDEKLLSFLINSVEENKHLIEVANHGWNHENFTHFTKENQSMLLQKTNEKINAIFGIKPLLFIPPFNSLNGDTLAAAKENNISYISSHKNNSFLFDRTNSTIKHFPFSSITGIQTQNLSWINYPSEQILNEIANDIESQGYSVVMVHPQEYAIRNGTIFTAMTDTKQLKELGLLLDMIKQKGIRFVTITQLDDII